MNRSSPDIDEELLDSDEMLDDPDDLYEEELEESYEDEPPEEKDPPKHRDRPSLAEELDSENITPAEDQPDSPYGSSSGRGAIKLKDIELTPDQKALHMLKHAAREEALRLLERSARLPWEYEQVMATWNLEDQNRERRQRQYELLRGNVPVDYGVNISTATVFPRYLNDPIRRAVQRGNFDDALADCVHDMQDFSTKEYVREAVSGLIRNHKESLFTLYIKLIPPQEWAMLRGSSFQTVYRTRDTMLQRLREKAYGVLKEMQEQGYQPNKQERAFITAYEHPQQKTEETE